jgi:hypothetical protein
MRKVAFITAVFSLAVASCGIFDPRPVEYPANEAVQDQFNFASLLWNTNRQFTKLEYADLFTEDFVYVDINGNEFDRKTFTDHLYTIQRRYEISITWRDDSLHDKTIQDTFFIDRSYHVSAMDTVAIPPKSYTVNDQASFKLIFNSTKNNWNICYWKDKYQGMSIFHPLFTPDF